MNENRIGLFIVICLYVLITAGLITACIFKFVYDMHTAYLYTTAISVGIYFITMSFGPYIAEK